MKRKASLLLAIYFILIPFFSSGQQREWMHLHIDKDIYLPGETIWFKAYLYARQRPSLGTSNLYVALYNGEGKLIDQKHYPVFDGTSMGDFLVPDSLVSPMLQIKAFTKNMLLADSQHIYSRIIQVYRKPGTAQKGMAAVEPAIAVNIFPEGGTLINGVNNYIALKAVDQNAVPAPATAAVITGQGKVIDSVFFNSMGLGTFQFIPEQGESYWAVWQDRQGITHKTAFPRASETGVTFHTEISGNKLYYSIHKNSRLLQLERLHLSILAGNDLLYKESIAIKDQQKFVHSFSIDSLPPGVFQLILSDNLENIVQQKLIYIKNKVAPPVINILEKSDRPQGKNVLEIVVEDTILTNLSLSIADLGFYQDQPVASISDELLLNNSTANLYSSAGDEKKTNLVLITQETRNPENTNMPAKEGHLSFAFNYLDNRHPLPDGSLITLIVNDRAYGKQFLNLAPRTHTNFLASDLVFYDSAKVYFQLEGRKELSEKFSINIPEELKHPGQVKPVQPVLIAQRANKTRAGSDMDRYLTRRDKFNELQTIKEVVVKTKYVNPVTRRLQELDEKYASGMFRGLSRGYQLNALDDPSAEISVDAFSYILYRIPGLTTRGAFGNRTVYGRSGPVMLFIDETESPVSMLETVNPKQLAYIKYIPGIVIGSSFTSGDGALYIYLKKGNENNTAPAMRSFYVKGYNLPNEFTQPDHSGKQQSLAPDYRSTLYWNPYIVTDKKNSRVKIEYYNNDVAGKQLLTLRGFNAAGELIELYKQID
jgi:hypothetical protein